MTTQLSTQTLWIDGYADPSIYLHGVINLISFFVSFFLFFSLSSFLAQPLMVSQGKIGFGFGSCIILHRLAISLVRYDKFTKMCSLRRWIDG